jgi:hypothetical protein
MPRGMVLARNKGIEWFRKDKERANRHPTCTCTLQNFRHCRRHGIGATVGESPLIGKPTQARRLFCLSLALPIEGS